MILTFLLCLLTLVSTLTVALIGLRVAFGLVVDVNRMPPEFWDQD